MVVTFLIDFYLKFEQYFTIKIKTIKINFKALIQVKETSLDIHMKKMFIKFILFKIIMFS